MFRAIIRRGRGGTPVCFLFQQSGRGDAFTSIGCGYVIAALLFVGALGYPAGNIAYGTMISLHVTSIVFLEGLWLGDSPFRVRLRASLCTLVAVWSLVYAPAVG